MVVSDICVLNFDEEELPRSSLSVVLVGTASDNSEINNDKITLNLNAREYIDKDLLLVRVTQVNFIESNYSSNKSSNYAWENKQTSNSIAQSTLAQSTSAQFTLA
ncbi:hypothetical protein RCL_jg7073.t1 [Rhizophagus clarus]|uniref:Uncharacterized protein n=1 Tax=Rhizophagus clarus TaxID=94130 RepID=A0A8H3LY96_9GLOM|nr:hypothetical protein RCL_jg7073.t1 [Rhizophagus clarus]